MFIFEVKDGEIIAVNGVSNINDLAKVFADQIQENWPAKIQKSIEIVRELTDYPSWRAGLFGKDEGRLIPNNPATACYLIEVHKKLMDLFQKFEETLEVPKVLENGSYSVCPVNKEHVVEYVIFASKNH